MKKISKLQINSERLLKHDELIVLRGGYGSCDFVCYVHVAGTETVGVACGTGVLTVQDECNNFYASVGGHCHCYM